MKITIKKELMEIIDEIIEMNKDVDNWDNFESSDMFQNGNYCGGFDSIEQMFTFSVYLDGKEYWFQLTLDEIFAIKEGVQKEVDVRPADL